MQINAKDAHILGQKPQAYDIKTGTAAGKSYDGTQQFDLVDLGAYKPLHDIVIVQFKQAAEKSAGGIIVPDIAQRAPEEGLVVCVGPGNVTFNGHYCPVNVKRGDRVRFNAQAFGNAIKLANSVFPGVPEGVRLLEMRETDILGAWPTTE